MSDSLRGRAVFITAAGQGIGRAAAVALHDAGACVYATDINLDALNSLGKQYTNIHCSRLDVTDPTAVQKCIDGLPSIEVLFNCAGYVHQGSILECSERDWRFSFDLNVTSMFHTCRIAIPRMKANRRGSIINMSSVVSSVKGTPQRFAYAASKAAVIGLTKSIAADFVQLGIRCNALCPGTVETPSLQERMRESGDIEKAKAAFISRQPMGRLGTPDEIAQAVLYLASDASAFMTGQVWIIDGGWSI